MKFNNYEKAQLRAFFQEVYGRVWEAFQKHYPEAYIEIRPLPEPNKKREFFPIHTLGFDKAVEEAINYAEKLNSERYNVFWGIALRKEKSGSKEATIPYIAFVPFDLDILKDHLNISKEDLENLSPEEAREKVLSYYYKTIRPRFEKFGLIPSWVYYTGHGVQGIWVLTGFISEPDLLEVKTYLVEAMNSDSHIYELARILRVPFSVNWKVPEHPKKGELIERNEVAYEWKDFKEKLKAYYKEFGPKTSQSSRSISVNLPELRKKFSQTKRPPCVEVALNGVKAGNRNQTAYFLASYFAQIGWTYQEIEDFLVNEWDPRNQPPIAEDDGVNSLKATIRSAYESVTGKKVRRVRTEDGKETIEEEEPEDGPKAQKLSGCSWARSLGLCPFKSLAECPIGRRALANKLRAVIKEIDNTPRTLEDLRKYIVANVPGSAKWVNEIISYLEAKGFKEVTKLDLLHVLRELNPTKKLKKSPREEAKKEKVKTVKKPAKDLSEFKEDELIDVARYYIMKGIELDTGKLPLIKIDPPFKFLVVEKKGTRSRMTPNMDLITDFAKKLAIDPEEPISGWTLVEKVKEAFNIPDDEVRAIIVEAIKEMATTPHARLPPCIEGIIDKIADGEPPKDSELAYLVRWVKYRAQGRTYLRLRKGGEKARKLELFRFMIEMLPGFEGDLGKWLAKISKLYENAEPFRCPYKEDIEIRELCNMDKCPFVPGNAESDVEAVLTGIEAVYIYGPDKMGIVIDGEEKPLDYVPPLEARSTNAMLRKFLAELEDAYGSSLFVDPEDLLAIFQDLRRRAIRKPPLLSEDEVIENALIKYFTERLEMGVVHRKLGFVEGYITFDPKSELLYVHDKEEIIRTINTAMERNGLRKFSRPEEITPRLKKLRGFFIGVDKNKREILDSSDRSKVKHTVRPWIFNFAYIKRAVGGKIAVKVLETPEEVFYPEAGISKPKGEPTEKTVEDAVKEIRELLKEKPRKYDELYEVMKERGYPEKLVTEALEELMLEVRYDPKTDEYRLDEEAGVSL